jgi:hypothetical protein
VRCDALGNAVRFQIGNFTKGILGIRGFSKGIVIALKATESQVVIRIINDDMRICSAVTEGVLFGKES